MGSLRRHWLIAAAAGSVAFVLALTAGLYLGGQRQAVAQLCRWGMPNLTVPPRFRPELQHWSAELRCVFYGRRTRIEGVIWSDGFESSGFFPGRHVYEAIARRGLTYPGLSILMDDQSDPHNLLRQFPTDPQSLGARSILVTLDGWMSEEIDGGFGHLGGQSQQILVDRIIAASVPPEPLPADYDRWQRMLRASE